MTVFVERVGAAGSTIKGVYGNRQPGIADEALADTDPGVVVFRTAASTARTNDQAKQSAFLTTIGQAVADNAAYIALASPTAAQTTAEVKRLAQQVNALLRRLTQQD